MSPEPALERLQGLAELDRLLHEPSRLLIVAHLRVLEEADFLFMLHQTGLTRGNLGSHMRRLEEAGVVTVHKAFVDRRPLTTYRLTDDGRAAFDAYRETLLQALGGS